MKSTVKIWRDKEKRYRYLEKIGKIVSFTKIIDGNYFAGIIEMKNKKRTAGELVDMKEVKMGEKVEGVLRRLGKSEKNKVIEYGVKWKKL